MAEKNLDLNAFVKLLRRAERAATESGELVDRDAEAWGERADALFTAGLSEQDTKKIAQGVVAFLMASGTHAKQPAATNAS